MKSLDDKRYYDRRLPVGGRNHDLLDFLLEPNWTTDKWGRRIKTVGTREKIQKYARFIWGSE